MKKLVGLFIIGIIVSFILYMLYRLLFSEPEMRSPLPKEEGVNVIFVTPSTKK